MPAVQFIDRKKFSSTHPIYRGGGIVTKSSLPFKPLNNRQLYMSREGGFIDLSSIVNAAKNTIEFVRNNQDLIKTGVSTVGEVASMAKGISDAVKSSRDLEQLKTIKEIQKNKKNKKIDYELSAEQEEQLKKIGSGFAKF